MPVAKNKSATSLKKAPKSKRKRNTKDLLTLLGIVIGVLSLMLAVIFFWYSSYKQTETDRRISEILETNKKISEILANVDPVLESKNPPVIKEREYQKLHLLVETLKKEKASIEIENLIKLGNVEFTHGYLDLALSYYSDALEQAKSRNDNKRIGICFGNIGVVYNKKGDPDTALEYFNNALEIDREIGYREGEAGDLGNMGNVYVYKGDLDEALKHYEKALEIYREIGYHQGEVNNLGSIGIVYKQERNFKAALKYLNEALDVLEKYNLAYGKDVILKAIEEVKTQQKP